MKSLNTKIVLAALGFAVLATPALAARHRQPQVTAQPRALLMKSSIIQMAHRKPEAQPIAIQAPNSTSATKVP
jgi:hypothetical protein